VDNNEAILKINIGKRITYPFPDDDGKYLRMATSDDAMLNMAMKFYHQELLQSEDAIKYLKSRAIYTNNVIDQFNLGYSNRKLGLELQQLSRAEAETSRGALQRLGVLKPSGHELFYGAAIFPILDDKSRIVGCYGRRITPEFKPRKIYHRHWYSGDIGFFNYPAVECNHMVIYCKNPIDALSWWVNGFTNVVSTLGHSDFTEQHAALLKQAGIHTVYLAMGTTPNALVAARRISQMLKQQQINSMFVLYPNGLDANSFVMQSTSPQEELKQLLDASHQYVVN
jgi:DNA primase